jgi:plastocyanin
MRRIAVLAMSAILGLALLVPQSAHALTVPVTAVAFTYVPAAVVLRPGDNLTFTNLDPASIVLFPHTLTCGLGPPFAPNGKCSTGFVVFGATAPVLVTLAPGEASPFYCLSHPWMRGVLAVTPV